MNDFIKEVQEDIRRERFDKLFHDYGSTLIALAIVIVVGVAAGSWFNTYRQQQKEQAGELYRNAIGRLDTKEYMTLLDEVMLQGTEGYQQLAAFSRAKALVKEKEFDKAVAAYDAIRVQGVVEAELRHLADYFAVSVEINQQGDVSSIGQRFNRLQAADVPWRSSVKELYASYLAQQGDVAKSVILFKELTEDSNVPSAIGQRARHFLSLLTTKQVSESE